MIRAYRYKMKPTNAQEAFFEKCFGSCRFVYNNALSERISTYQKEKKSLSFFDQCASLRRLKELPEYAWLGEIPALSLNYALLNLNRAYNSFFRTKSGFPKYKTKKALKDSVKFNPNSTKYDFQNYKVRIPKLGWVRICKGRIFDQSAVKLNSTTVSRDPCGTFWCTVSVDDGFSPQPKAKVDKETAIGIDVGISEFAVLSNGEKIPNLRFNETEEKNIAKAQRFLSRKKHGSGTELASHRYLRYKKALAKKQRRVENRRTDFLQKTSSSLVRKYDSICIEDLNVQGMLRNHNLARFISSVSWGRFFSMLEYKCAWNGANFLKVGKFDATSQICSVCGYKNADTKDLSVREWTCPHCGTHHNRDHNAAVNILNIAIEKYKSPEVTGITDANGVDSESNMEIRPSRCNYASDETSMKCELQTKFQLPNCELNHAESTA